MTISIVLADDHQVVLDGLRLLLGNEPDFRVVGEATDGLAVLPVVENLRPDVLLLDLMMPGLNGLEVTRKLHERVPQTKIVVVSMHANEAYVVEAMANGASGYVLKQAPSSEVVRAIHEVFAGKRFLSAPLSEAMLVDYQQKSRDGILDRYHTLSGREREVLQLAAEGLTNVEIAKRLTIGKRTVETHRANLIRKLGLRSQAELVKYAVRRGIVSAD
jgi:two-component system, NarL family, response regulator NreC